jgi:hypothetical protein
MHACTRIHISPCTLQMHTQRKVRWWSCMKHDLVGHEHACTHTYSHIHIHTNMQRKIVWWPFTQHGMVDHNDVTVIDSRSGEHWCVFHTHTYTRHMCVHACIHTYVRLWAILRWQALLFMPDVHTYIHAYIQKYLRL